jgi:hypothetical protein
MDTGVHRYTECEIICPIEINSHICKKLPQSVSSIGVILYGTSKHNTVFTATHTPMRNAITSGEIANLTTRRIGGSTTYPVGTIA